MSRFIIRCPVLLEDEDERCKQRIELDVTKAEPATWYYPGYPGDFEVVNAECGHKDEIEAHYTGDVWEEIRDQELAALEAKAEWLMQSAGIRARFEAMCGRE